MKLIAYIEDDPLEGEVIQRLYQTVRTKFHDEVDFEVIGSWEKGVEFVHKSRPDVVILDLVLPPTVDTEKALENIAAVHKSWPPIVVLTGNTYDLTLRRKCILAGADDFMVKPDARHGGCELLCERVYTSYLRRLRGTGA